MIKTNQHFQMILIYFFKILLLRETTEKIMVLVNNTNAIMEKDE